MRPPNPCDAVQEDVETTNGHRDGLEGDQGGVSGKTMNNAREAAREYIGRGWPVVPLPPRQKAAMIDGWAKLYRALGWRIIPAGHGPDRKRPSHRCKWAEYRLREPTDAELARWFGKDGKSVPAVILGEPSGGLACRDFDHEDDYFAWTLDHPELAKSMAAVETGRGFHVYFILTDGELFRDYGDGELRGDAGHYCILPPAVHKSGKVYKWLVEPDERSLRRFTLAEATHAGLIPDSQGQQGEAQRNPMSSVSSVSSVPSVSLASLPTADREAVLLAIEATAPTGTGERNRRIFDFARKLKAIGSLADRAAQELREIVKAWHTRALPNIATRDFADTWGDFLGGWDKIRQPANGEFMNTTFERAKASPCATGHDEAQDILAAFCRELQKAVGDEPFFLSVRDAAEPFGHDEKWGLRRLRVLEAEGWIVCVERGSAQTQRATRFKYAGPSAGATMKTDCQMAGKME